MIVGLSGYARSGKDEAAKALVAQGWERRAFADILRDFLYRLNPIVKPRYETAFPVIVPDARVQEVIDKVGWDGYKETPYGDEIRELLQRLGTECGRELIGDKVWINATLGPDRAMDYHKEKIVVTDVRFPNEFDEIMNRGGMMIRIHRPGVEAPNDHISEHALDPYANYYDADIVNSGSINELHDKIRRQVALHF